MYNDFCDLILEKNKYFKNDMNEKAKVNVYQNVALKFLKANNVFFKMIIHAICTFLLK